MSSQIHVHQGIPQIPFDLFVKKTLNRVLFTDAYGNLVYVGKSHHHSFLSPSHPSRALFDSSGNPLIAIIRNNDGCSEELLFSVEQTLNTSSKMEFDIVLVREDAEAVALTMRGCPYWRSCTIYQDKSIVAQTNLMHKLGFKKLFAWRNEFRVTFFPGFSNYNLIAALLLIFLDGR
ncbi:hypothetical protein Cgig2_023958 [Carnegiea gigantea]|uniref:Uncharacterized protein n=1 Tax=Carnegiea gigantea TaxID=171969 RepID=A0A9Q1KC74_9CARY|nr:hypothetical protein Cgig2_023958 [Carnegiea gigantea]